MPFITILLLQTKIGNKLTSLLTGRSLERITQATVWLYRMENTKTVLWVFYLNGLESKEMICFLGIFFC